MAHQQLIDGSIDIEASPADVWAIVSDLKRMGEWSPQCRRMYVRGDVGVGTRTLNVNKQGWLVWPTRSKVVAFEPQRRIAFRVLDNRTVWSFDLEPTATGTRLTESRTTPDGISTYSKVAVKRLFGGTEVFEARLADGIRQTLERVKSEAERG